MISFAKILIFSIAALPLSANIIWPGLYLHQYLFSLYSIIPALIVEWTAIKYIFNFSWRKAFLVATTINVISAAVGYILYIPASFLYEYGLSFTLHKLLNDGTFSNAGWIANYFFATFFTTILEYYAIRVIFKIKFPLKSRPFFYFLLANIVSVSLSFSMMYFEEHKAEQKKTIVQNRHP